MSFEISNIIHIFYSQHLKERKHIVTIIIILFFFFLNLQAFKSIAIAANKNLKKKIKRTKKGKKKIQNFNDFLVLF